MAKYKEFCPVCGMVNLDDRPRCMRCGEPLTLPEKKKKPSERPSGRPDQSRKRF